jgi:hypothetical protein
MRVPPLSHNLPHQPTAKESSLENRQTSYAHENSQKPGLKSYESSRPTSATTQNAFALRREE